MLKGVLALYPTPAVDKKVRPYIYWVIEVYDKTVGLKPGDFVFWDDVGEEFVVRTVQTNEKGEPELKPAFKMRLIAKLPMATRKYQELFAEALRDHARRALEKQWRSRKGVVHVVFEKVSDPKYKVTMSFRSWDEAVEEMTKRHHRWIVLFNTKNGKRKIKARLVEYDAF